MKNKIINIFRFCKDIINRIIYLFKIHKVVFCDSYYPELKRKKMIIRYWDNIKWILKYGELNLFYNLYGFDIKDYRNINDYINYLEFARDRNKFNKLDNEYSYIVLLRDKIIFEKYMSSNKINVAKTKAIIINGTIYDNNFAKKNNIDLLFDSEVFVKNISGECADGVYYIKNKQDYIKNKKQFKNGIFIVQKKVIQNKKMSTLYPDSVNTIRIVTINNDNNIQILSSGLRIGTKQSKNVDNWAAGGFYVEINDDGTLTEYGFAKPKYGGKKRLHPDTKVSFKNFKVPEYDKVKEMVKKAHKSLYGIHSIGWDVAITDRGPILIEGNDNWEISLMQANHGLKREWKKCLEKRKYL